MSQLHLLQSHGHNIKNFKYPSITDESFLNPMFYKYFWNKLAANIPAFVSPNFITLSGIAVFYVCYALAYFSLVYNNGYQYYLFALGVFAWQTTDAIDGIVARETKQSSPLGLMFDHCLDPLVYVPMALSLLYALNLSHCNMLVLTATFAYVLTTNMFFMTVNYAEQTEFQCTQNFNVHVFGAFGITEFQCTVICIFIISQMYSHNNSNVWNNYYVNYILIIVMILSAFKDSLNYFIAISKRKMFKKVYPLVIYDLYQLIAPWILLLFWNWYCDNLIITKHKFLFYGIAHFYSVLAIIDINIKTVVNYKQFYIKQQNKLCRVPYYFYPLLISIFLSICFKQFNAVFLICLFAFIGVYALCFLTITFKRIAKILNIEMLAATNKINI